MVYRHVHRDLSDEEEFYEDVQPRDWPSFLGEHYRRCCTLATWHGQVLMARAVNAFVAWDNDAWFDLVDRWMNDDDTADLNAIRQQRGDYPAVWDWHRQKGLGTDGGEGTHFSRFAWEMWQTYRFPQDPNPEPGQ